MRTKSSNICKVEVHKTKFNEKSVKFNCIRIWNDSPFHIRNLENGITFEEKLCCYLLEKRDDIYVKN